MTNSIFLSLAALKVFDDDSGFVRVTASCLTAAGSGEKDPMRQA